MHDVRIQEGPSRAVGRMVACTEHGPAVVVQHAENAPCPLCQAHRALGLVQDYCHALMPSGPQEGATALARSFAAGVLAIIDGAYDGTA